MLGLYFLMSLVALGVIIAWFVRNDGLKPDEPTRGLLRMMTTQSAAGHRHRSAARGAERR